MKKKKVVQPGSSPSAFKKLKTGISSLFDKLESSHSSFLAQARSQAVQDELRKQAKQVAAEGAVAPSGAKPAPAALGAGGSGSTSSTLRAYVDAEEIQRRQERQQRFQEAVGQQAAAAKDRTLVAARAEAGGVARGSSQALEKEYLRLTSLPSVADVRPPPVLRQALELVKRKWTQEGNYKYACEQLKSIRQDLTVQHVRNTLTVQVYETHARIAIEVGDWAEYRQCHSVLQGLYAGGLEGERSEFAAYGLLYAAAAGSGVLSHEMKEVVSEPALLSDRFVSHALAVCASYTRGDFVAFLKQYEAAPRMAPYLLDLLLSKLRHRAYGAVVAAYLPSVPVDTLQAWLGLTPGRAAREFLLGKGAVLAGDRASLDIRACRAALVQAEGAP